MNRLVIKRDELCYQNVVGLIVSHISYGLSIAVYNRRDLSFILSDGKCYYSGTPSTTNKELTIHVKKIILSLSNDNQWPNEIYFEEDDLGTNYPYMEYPYKIEKAEVFGIWQATAAYVTFYSNVESIIKSSYGEDCKNWPEILNFARVLRNAVAHCNKININNLNSSEFTWRCRTYGPQDNGRYVIFQDFAFADIILLMKDISDQLM